MSVWKDYSSRTSAGAAGGLYDLTAHVVDSFCLEGENVKCGMGVIFGTDPGTNVALPAAGAAVDKFAGVVMNGGTNEMDMNGNIVLRDGSTQSVMRSGRVWVRLAADVEPAYGDPVNLILEGEDAGCFSNAGGLAVNARFIGTRQNGIAAVELYQQLNA